MTQDPRSVRGSVAIPRRRAGTQAPDRYLAVHRAIGTGLRRRTGIRKVSPAWAGYFSRAGAGSARSPVSGSNIPSARNTARRVRRNAGPDGRTSKHRALIDAKMHDQSLPHGRAADGRVCADGQRAAHQAVCLLLTPDGRYNLEPSRTRNDLAVFNAASPFTTGEIRYE